MPVKSIINDVSTPRASGGDPQNLSNGFAQAEYSPRKRG